MNMKKNFFTFAALGALCALGAAETEQRQAESVIRGVVKNVGKIDFRNDGTATITTADGKLWGKARRTSPAKSGAEGFRGPVPVMVFIDASGKVAAVRPLPNREDRRFWERVLASGLFDSWSGFPVREAAKLEVDAVTGATYSSSAVIDSTRSILRREIEKK